MSKLTGFPGGKFTSSRCSNSGSVGQKLSPELTATSSLAEGNTHLTAWGPVPGE